MSASRSPIAAPPVELTTEVICGPLDAAVAWLTASGWPATMRTDFRAGPIFGAMV